jgi:hypothetical protein
LTKKIPCRIKKCHTNTPIQVFLICRKRLARLLPLPQQRGAVRKEFGTGLYATISSLIALLGALHRRFSHAGGCSQEMLPPLALGEKLFVEKLWIAAEQILPA